MRAVGTQAVRSDKTWLMPLLVVSLRRVSVLPLVFANLFLFLMLCIIWLQLLLQMSFNLYHLRDSSSDQGQTKRQRNEGDAGRVLKVPCTQKGYRVRGEPPTASKLEAVLVPRMRSGE